jgi:hypothetical protein
MPDQLKVQDTISEAKLGEQVMNRKVSIILAIAVSCATMTLSGCSLIGLGIGAMIDSSKPETYITTPQTENLKPGKTITVTKTNGEKITGEYIGLDFVTVTDHYEEQYAKVQEQNGDRFTLPNISDHVTMVDLLSNQIEVQFQGFSLDFRGNKYLLFKRATGAETSRVRLEIITQIRDSEGNAYQTNSLRSLLENNMIPAVTNIVIQVENEAVLVPSAEIEIIQLRARKGAALTGLIIGACVDAIVIVVSLSAVERDLESAFEGLGKSFRE